MQKSKRARNDLSGNSMCSSGQVRSPAARKRAVEGSLEIDIVSITDG